MRTLWTEKFAGYSWQHLRKDLIAGLIVGIVAIPLAMSFAIASGVKPETGIYTTIVAGMLIALFGGSRFQVSGPTGAFIPVLFAIVYQYGYDNLLLAGFLSGILLILFGLLRLGKLIQFIPRPVTIGFTTGIAVTIFTGQIANFLGLHGLAKHDSFLLNMEEIATHLATTNVYSVGTALICLAILLWLPRRFPKIPAPLVGLVISSAVAAFCFPGKVATIGTMFGAIPSTLPALHLPQISGAQIEKLISPALVIAMLGSIESLLSAVVTDGMTGTQHNSNRELIGQGIGNMIAPLFGGIPATGAIARTATNVKSGATSPLSAVIHSVVVLLVLLVLAPSASAIPLASLAPILMVVAWNMSEYKAFSGLLALRTGDSLILMVTFLLTVFFSLTTAVEWGLLLAGILFIKKMCEQPAVEKTILQETVWTEGEGDGPSPSQLKILDVTGPLFFGVARQFELSMQPVFREPPQLLILRMGQVPMLDTTGEAYLAKVVRALQQKGTTVLIAELNENAQELLRRTGLHKRLGEEHFFVHTREAIRYAWSRLEYEEMTQKGIGAL